MAKDNFIFYRQWWESIRELEPEQQSIAYDALMKFAFDGVEPTDSVARALTAMMRSTIKRDLEKYERVCERNRANGKRGGAPKGNKNARRNNDNPESNDNPKQPKTTHSVVLDAKPEIAEIIPDVVAEHEPSEPVIVISESPPESQTELERMFDDFRRMYPGTKRGFKTEFDNFKRKNPKHWREIIPQLTPALQRLMDWHERARAAGQFVPNYKNLATWLNQQCWTEELPEIQTPITPRNNGTNTINNGNTERFADNQIGIARLVVDKLTTPDRPEPDISGNY
nr:MAG TPA: putative replisome organizer protein [Caudoviricetes sp.]